MTVDNTLILKLENLAKLNLSEQEKGKLIDDLEKIIGMFSQIEKVDTSNVAPLIHMTDGNSVMREDVVGDHMNIQDFASNAPLMQENMFAVPKVID